MRLPNWVGERQFVVVHNGKVVAAFFVREKAEAYASKRGYGVIDRWAG